MAIDRAAVIAWLRYLVLRAAPPGSSDSELRDAAEVLLDKIGAPPHCRATWRAGLFQEHHAPSDGAVCTYAPGHLGYCSFIAEAQSKGWEPPSHVDEQRIKRDDRLLRELNKDKPDEPL